MVGDTTAEGNDIDVCLQSLSAALRNGPLALGFEAPMFVPIRPDPKRLTAARKGDSQKGMPTRPFSASAGATALVTGLIVVSYILTNLCPFVPEATATLDWRLPPVGPGRLTLFEAFVTNQLERRLFNRGKCSPWEHSAFRSGQEPHGAPCPCRAHAVLAPYPSP